MARLNEPPVSTDSIDTLRRKLLRQNRDLAKSNNIRALRIRELENECACMLSENLELRGRILELEKEAEDNEARRIADHALAIKDKLEAQLTEWGTLLAGLGLEPPMKRHSPRIRKSINQRMSFHSHRPSPSQRRLRDVARDIEELGHINEHKIHPRRSMDHQQILALCSEASAADSPELGPPPVSQFIDDDPVKVDSPSRASPLPAAESSPKAKIEPPVVLPSPEPEKSSEELPPLEKKEESLDTKPRESPTVRVPEPLTSKPVKTGFKRKFAISDENEDLPPTRSANENRPLMVLAEKGSLRAKAEGKTLKELANIRKEARQRATTPVQQRKPLASKSTNDDIASPRKNTKSTKDDVTLVKTQLAAAKSAQDRSRSKPRNPRPIKIKDTLSAKGSQVAPKDTTGLVTPLAELALLPPCSPEPVPSMDEQRGDTPPPADISSKGETSRPSRRNRTAVSYAEPNLRDKMRRPSKQLFDAVAGEQFSRRSSQCGPLTLDSGKIKRESDAGESLNSVPSAKDATNVPEPEDCTARLQADESSSPLQHLPSSVVTSRRRRRSSAVTGIMPVGKGESKKNDEPSHSDNTSLDNAGSGDADLYEFDSSSPQVDVRNPTEAKSSGSSQARSARRFSAMLEGDDEFEPRERKSSRRKSMMI